MKVYVSNSSSSVTTDFALANRAAENSVPVVPDLVEFEIRNAP